MNSGRILLDTHVFLWWRGDPERITPSARQSIAEADLVYVSVASAWEIAIKKSLGRLQLPASVESGVRESGFEKLAATFTHVESVADLPHHHRDPFDRLLIAQAKAENLVLATHDKTLGKYDAQILWC